MLVATALMSLMDTLPGAFFDHSKMAHKDYVLKKVKEDGCDLEYAAASLQADKEVALAAVKQFGWALQYAAPSMRNAIALPSGTQLTF